MALRILKAATRRLNFRFSTNYRWKSNTNNHIPDSEQNRNDEAEKIDEAALPPEPTFCCMSGCPNCVWIKYAQEVAQLFDNGDVIAKKKITEKVHDPKIRAYLFMKLGLKDDDKE